MKIKFLLIGTSLSFIPILSYAQCVETTNCETLGYTETSCNGGKGVKCPFGNKWACLGANEEEFCTKYEFNQTCTGKNQMPGSKICNGKYNYCNCADGYEWKDGNCQKEILNGAQGDLYYCNGAVVAVKASGMNFYVAMKDLGTMNWSNANSRCQDYSFCGNIKGTLPSRERLLTMYNNKSSLDSLLSTNGGTNLSDEYYWSSTTYLDGRHYVVHMSSGSVIYNLYGSGDSYGSYVRPVLTSW